MPEEKKKRGIARRILKWIGLSALSLLLIAAIYFQAPWKVITLLVIFLLASTILPKPYRKWFWLSVGVVIVILIVWVFLPDETEGWRSYTFDKELAALEAKYAVPDSENAALIYNQAFETLGSDANEPNFFWDSTRQFWNKKDHPETAQWLKERKGTIEKLMQASKMEKCYFPISTDLMSLSLSNYLAPMRRCAYLFTSSANNDIAEGRIDVALKKYCSLIKMADHMRQQPTIIDTLVGIAIEGLAFGRFKAFTVTSDATEQHLNVIEKALAGIKHDWSVDLPKILESEKLMPKSMVAMFYEVNQKGKTRFSRDPFAVMRHQMKEQLDANQIEDQETIKLLKSSIHPLTYWQKKLIKVGTVLAWFYTPSTPQKAGAIIDAAYEKYYAIANPNFDLRKEPKKTTKIPRLNYRYLAEHLAGVPKQALHIHDLCLRNIAQQRSCQIIIALRRYKNKHGRWPESLDDIKTLVPAEVFVDPINGSSFVYKLTDDNFTLYSKGKNNIDEDGRYNSRWDPNTLQNTVEQDDFLIWPRRMHDTQPQDSNSE